MKITTAARRIARAENRSSSTGGVHVYGIDGTGGAWYADNARPRTRGCVVVGCGGGRMTYAMAQEMIDEVVYCDAPGRTEKERYAYLHARGRA